MELNWEKISLIIETSPNVERNNESDRCDSIPSIPQRNARLLSVDHIKQRLFDSIENGTFLESSDLINTDLIIDDSQNPHDASCNSLFSYTGDWCQSSSSTKEKYIFGLKCNENTFTNGTPGIVRLPLEPHDSDFLDESLPHLNSPLKAGIVEGFRINNSEYSSSIFSSTSPLAEVCRQNEISEASPVPDGIKSVCHFRQGHCTQKMFENNASLDRINVSSNLFSNDIVSSTPMQIKDKRYVHYSAENATAWSCASEEERKLEEDTSKLIFQTSHPSEATYESKFLIVEPSNESFHNFQTYCGLACTRISSSSLSSEGETTSYKGTPSTGFNSNESAKCITNAASNYPSLDKYSKEINEHLNIVDSSLTDSSRFLAPVSNGIVEGLSQLSLKDDNVEKIPSFLLDLVISECKNYAALATANEPIKSFIDQYLTLTVGEKEFFHSLLFDFLDKQNEWVRCPENFRSPNNSIVLSIVDKKLLKFMDASEDWVTIIDTLDSKEVADIFIPLCNSNLIVDDKIKVEIGNIWFSPEMEGKMKEAICEMTYRNYIKMCPTALIGMKMCLDLFSLPLNLNEKCYNSADLARYIDGLMSLDGISLMFQSLDQSNHVIRSGQEYNDFYELCKLKYDFLERDNLEENEFCLSSLISVSADLAVTEAQCSQNELLMENPFLKFKLMNLIYALNEKLDRLTAGNLCDASINIVAFFCFSIFLTQEIAGFSFKSSWYKKKIKCSNRFQKGKNDFRRLSEMLKLNVSTIDMIFHSNFVAGLLVNKTGLTVNEKLKLEKLLRLSNHKKVQIESAAKTDTKSVNYKTVRKGEQTKFGRPCLYNEYGREFPNCLRDSGKLLLNAIYLVFWEIIYQLKSGMFVNRFQKVPLDWGTFCFFKRRETDIYTLINYLKRGGISAVIDKMRYNIDKFSRCYSVVDWCFVNSNVSTLLCLMKIINVDKFFKIAEFILRKADERSLGFPDMTIWNEEASSIKFVALKKPSDPLYPYQIVWLEKLGEFDLVAEECQIISKRSKNLAIVENTEFDMSATNK